MAWQNANQARSKRSPGQYMERCEQQNKTRRRAASKSAHLIQSRRGGGGGGRGGGIMQQFFCKKNNQMRRSLTRQVGAQTQNRSAGGKWKILNALLLGRAKSGAFLNGRTNSKNATIRT